MERMWDNYYGKELSSEQVPGITWFSNLLGKYVQKQPSEVFYKKGVLRNFTKFTGKHLFQCLFFNNVAGPTSPTLLKKRRWHRCVPVNFVKILRTFFYRTPPRDCLCTLFIHYILSVFITDVTTIICPLNLLLINSRPNQTLARAITAVTMVLRLFFHAIVIHNYLRLFSMLFMRFI